MALDSLPDDPDQLAVVMGGKLERMAWELLNKPAVRDRRSRRSAEDD